MFGNDSISIMISGISEHNQIFEMNLHACCFALWQHQFAEDCKYVSGHLLLWIPSWILAAHPLNVNVPHDSDIRHPINTSFTKSTDHSCGRIYKQEMVENTGCNKTLDFYALSYKGGLLHLHMHIKWQQLILSIANMTRGLFKTHWRIFLQ